MEVQESGPAAATPWGPAVTASIHLGGSWSGAVLLQCELPTACRFAAVLLGIERPVRADDDVKDVMGELIHMVAGNLQAVTGEASCLSLPTVVEGGDLDVLGGQPEAQVDFVTPGGPLRVWVSEKTLQPQMNADERR